MFRVQTDPMIADGRKKRIEVNQEPFDFRTSNIWKAVSISVIIYKKLKAELGMSATVGAT